MLFDPSQQAYNFVTSKLINPNNVAGGRNVPSRQTGTGRVPVVTGLVVGPVQTYQGGTQYTLLWNEPPPDANVNHYNVFVAGALSNNQSLLGPYSAQGSPCYLRIVSSSASVITFYVQSVLNNGAVSEITASPSCTYKSITPATAVPAGNTLNVVGPASVTLTADQTVVTIDASAGAVTVKMVYGTADGQVVTMTNGASGAFTATALPNFGQTINGGTSYGIPISTTKTFTYSALGANWAVT